MIFWGVFWGAVLGAWFPGYSDLGPYIGGFLGFFAGLSLRWAIRSIRATAASITAPRRRLARSKKPSCSISRLSYATSFSSPASTASQ